MRKNIGIWILWSVILSLSFAPPCAASVSSGDLSLSGELDEFFEKIQQGGVADVEAAIAGGQDVNVTNKAGVSPLLALAQKISFERMEKWEVFRKENPKVVPLDLPILSPYAIASRDVEIARLLIGAGAAMKETDSRDGGRTLLNVYIPLGPEFVELLLKAGADPNDYVSGENFPLRLAVRVSRLTPEQRLRTVELLLAAGADVNRKNPGGETVLNSAAMPFVMFLPPEAERRLVEMLLGAGTDVNATSDWGLTPLMNWAMAGSAETVRLLLDAGADVAAKDRYGTTALMMALTNARWDSPQIVEMLIERGADVHVRDELGMTPLHVAAGLGSAPKTALLLKAGADLLDDHQSGVTPLHLATGVVAQETERNKGTFEERRKNVMEGLVLLPSRHEVLEMDFSATVRVLVEAGAKLNVRSGKDFKDPLGGDTSCFLEKTPLEFARILGNEEVVRYLESKGAE
ncbi:MAG: ankyrin repeat domain-containing protein [Synergistaceae bacterium]|jgi:ankyrin repeat protein|nr:ankyrin repeat domain-containing protein [Synergistaceae bacterium]